MSLTDKKILSNIAAKTVSEKQKPDTGSEAQSTLSAPPTPESSQNSPQVEPTSSSQPDGLYDDHGTLFDPELHKVDSVTGYPLKVKRSGPRKGRWVRKAWASQKESKSVINEPLSHSQGDTQPDPEPIEKPLDLKRVKKTAEFLADCFFWFCRFFGGRDKWTPTKEEKDDILKYTYEVCEEYRISFIKSIYLLIYSILKFVGARVDRGVQWAKSFGSWFKRKFGFKNAHSDSGPDEVGEIDPSTSPDQGV